MGGTKDKGIKVAAGSLSQIANNCFTTASTNDPDSIPSHKQTRSSEVIQFTQQRLTPGGKKARILGITMKTIFSSAY